MKNTTYTKRVLVAKIQNTYGVKLDPKQQAMIWRAFQWGRHDAASIIGMVAGQVGHDAIMTMSNENKTKVIFRKFRGDGDVIAIFPEEPFNEDQSLCMSYQHVGQHGSASKKLIDELDKAGEEEIEPLRKELISIGYELLEIEQG